MEDLISRIRAISLNDPYTYIFIISLVDILVPLPFELIPEHFLNRAKPEEIVVFKSFLTKAQQLGTDYFPYEQSDVVRKPGKEEVHVIYASEELPPDEWKYWIVSYRGSTNETHDLQQASLLLKNEIEYGFEFFTQAGSIGFSLESPATASYFTENQDFSQIPATARITIDDLRSIQTYHSLIKQLKPEYTHIRNAIKLFDDLRSLPRKSDFVLIGMFSIIESLISHSPRLEFFHDSIKHQIGTKIPLLQKRFVRNFTYSEYFGDGIKEETILSKLYDYRSNIVHTGISAMPDKLAHVLKGKDEVRRFLKELTKQLLMVSLREPELVTDLKLC